MTLPGEYFERRWRDDDDPWRIAERWYERRKRDLVLAALPRERFGRAFEPGCAAGHLTERLAARCDHLLSADVTGRAVGLTRARVGEASGTGGVAVERRAVPADWPEGRFDLVVVSELGYYLDLTDLRALADRAVGSLAPGGVVLACHWRHHAPDYPSTAEQVHDALAAAAAAALGSVLHHDEPDFLLDVWIDGEPSVARAEGWLPGRTGPGPS